MRWMILTMPLISLPSIDRFRAKELLPELIYSERRKDGLGSI
jgi:hypothetical protein